ncbi:MAG TPA: RnfABCDGE type electron transport complex subunit D [Thermosynechococcaceae cyanobacterium]
MLLKDARSLQILFLSLFLGLGVANRDWTLQPVMVAVTIATCLLTQWFLSSLVHLCPSQELPASRSPSLFTLLSPLITSLGLSLLLRADHLTTVMLASGAAIASKFLLRVGDKHLFNPANFGIVTALILTPDAWASPGQWGEDGWYGLLFVGAGGLVLQRVGRWDTTIAFLGTYAGLEAVRNLWLGWTWDVWAHRLMSGSLLLFALFMITDPRTIPNARIARLLWAGTIALVAFTLRNVFFLSTAVFWALFVTAPLTPLLDRVFPADRFSWLPAPASPALSPSPETP